MYARVPAEEDLAGEASLWHYAATVEHGTCANMAIERAHDSAPSPGRAIRTVIVAAAAMLVVLSGLGPLRAENAAPSVAVKEAPSAGTAKPDKIKQLSDLLDDPDVRAYLAARRASPPTDTAPTEQPPDTMAGDLGDELQGLRNHLRALAAAAPTLGAEFLNARTMLLSAVGQRDAVSLWVFMAAFVALGFGGEWLFSRLAIRWRTWLLALNLETTRERVWAVFARLFYGLGLIASYGIGSIGAFLLFDWTILLKEILLGYLIASLIVRLTFVFGRFFLAPGAERFRVAPVSTPAASFLFHRLGLVAVLLAFGGETIELLGTFGFRLPAQELSGYAVGILVLAIALETVWRFPHRPHEPTETEDVEATLTLGRRSKRFTVKLALSVTLILLWGLWVARAETAFWIIAFSLGLPAAIVLLQRSIHHVLRPPEAARSEDADSQRLGVIFVERGARSLLIVASAMLLGHVLGVDFVSLTMQDTLSTRILRGVLGVVIVALIADFLWHTIVALIDAKLAHNIGATTIEDPSHAARLQTLLPILKNLSLAILVVVAIMMMLAALGIQIGPLVASAGVVGVAIGFGAQTLVKDIISGIFYLVDDAFRIGEYIQSGTYKGTVESFSLRSVKLRHQRGALYTVPFGILGAVQNQSRDWVVDKILINVPYETDLEKVRKLVKKIGEALAEDAELGPNILNPLKMQGVTQFGDYAIQIQTKMMTKPGDVQFAARRKALIMIQQAFQANGIGFALPMVHVSGDGQSGAGAAQKGLALVKGGKVDEAV